jgi:NAD(P)-dependent dehydrogenase (short-subunit alcohol dehydrogenase family)
MADGCCCLLLRWLGLACSAGHGVLGQQGEHIGKTPKKEWWRFSQGAMTSLTFSVARQYCDQGVTCNGVAPCYVFGAKNGIFF